jgi:hypothetical protein
VGEWLSRELGIKIPLLAYAEISQSPQGGTKTLKWKENTPPLIGERDNLEEHTLNFHFPGRLLTSGIPQNLTIPV